MPFVRFERLVARAPVQVETWVHEGDARLVVADGSFLRPWENAEYAGVVLGLFERTGSRVARTALNAVS